MLHDIAPHVLSNAYSPRAPQAEDIAIHFDPEGVYLLGDAFPTCADYSAGTAFQYLLDYDGRAVFLADQPPLHAQRQPHRALRSLPQPLAFLGGTAQHLWDWYRNTRFCGRCGAPMTHSLTERAMTCPACGNTVYPRISPAVIVLIHNGGDRLMLAQGRRFVGGFYSCIAGYLEIGESLEQAVRREALEETGLHLTNIRYFGNQPWPFTDTHMVGFFAQADEREPIRIQREELADARWFSRDELPRGPQSIAIASAMIQHWLAHGANLPKEESRA